MDEEESDEEASEPANKKMKLTHNQESSGDKGDPMEVVGSDSESSSDSDSSEPSDDGSSAD